MRNPKSKTIRKIGPASTSTILPSPTRRRACRSKIQNPASRIERPASDPHSPAINHQLSTVNQQRTRNGKVARLPYPVRDMINRMLRNNIPHSQIVDALDELQFRVTERNISNWKTRGSYRDWCIAQDRALETR